MADVFTPMFQFGAQFLKMFTEFGQASDAAKRNALLIEFQQAVIQFNSMLATVQQQNTSLANDKRDLEEKIMRMEAWNTEKRRYKLATPYEGVTVYALQKSMSEGDPAHYVCANCFHDNKRSVLANTTNKEGWVAIVCAACKFSAQTRYRGLGPAKYAEDIGAPE